ncbi:lysophospholipid acyltransferase family protein [Peptococcaceae bacterium 1198_IL3148]
MFYNLARVVMRLVLLILRRWRVLGLNNLPRQGGVVVVSNHTSYWDPVAVGCALNRPIHYMAKSELFNNLLFATLIRGLKAFPVERGKSDRNAIRYAVNLLMTGQMIGVFPEGTRSTSGELQRAHLGAAMLAFKANVPIVPVAIVGAKGVLGKLSVIIGSPIPLPEYEGSRPSREQLENYSQQVMNQLSQLISTAR